MGDHDGSFLMRAQVLKEARKIEFFLYSPSDMVAMQCDSSRLPAFTLTYNTAMGEWRLVQERCERCQLAPPHLSCTSLGKQQVAFMRHSKEVVDDGLWNCMDVNIPGLFSDNRRIIWCPRQGYGNLADGPGADNMAHQLTTMKPAWNDEVESLVLDFKHRDILSSAKNFQLALRQKPKQVICQYGKLGRSTFALDCRYPMSLVQAFASAMTTAFWT